MASTGIHGAGTTFAGTTLGTVAEVTNISAGGFECDEIDLSSMDSTDNFRDFIGGMINAGEVSLTLIYTKAQLDSLYDAIAVTDTFTIT